MRKTAVINVVGLTPKLLGPYMPNLTAWINGGASATIRAIIPAVTCAVQATYLTGQYPDATGIVGNG